MRVALYTEDPPARAGIVATGLARVNRHIVQALSAQLTMGLSVSTALRHPPLDEDLDHSFGKINRWVFRFRPVLRHVWPAWRKIRGLPIEIPRHELRLMRAASHGHADVVLAPIGTDVSALGRAVEVAGALDLPLVAYLVDEPVAAARLDGVPLTAPQVSKFKSDLLACRAVLCITSGLAGVVTRTYGAPCVTAPLPFERVALAGPAVPRSRDIVFIGNTSHFYRDGLKDCVESIARCRSICNNLRLVFTIRSAFSSELQRLFGEDVVAVEPCPDDAALDRRLASALFAFVSYSFDERYRDMVTTSYPSKLTEYLCSARHIVVFAPSWSSAAGAMRSAGLSDVIHSAVDLEQLVADVASQPRDFSQSYRAALMSNHSYEQFRTALLASLSK